MRPNWDQTFMAVAESMALRSTCTRAHHGAVIVRENRILTTGYNGAPPGLVHCIEAGCLMEDSHCVRTLHAEENAILQAAYQGLSLVDSTIYVTGPPCIHDVKRIIAAGIKHVRYWGGYREDEMIAERIQWMTSSGVTYTKIGGREDGDQ